MATHSFEFQKIHIYERVVRLEIIEMKVSIVSSRGRSELKHKASAQCGRFEEPRSFSDESLRGKRDYCTNVRENC
jgi:hypothetical protein